MPRAGAFPRAFPEGSAKQVADFLLGKNMDKWFAIEGAYDLLGYGMFLSSGTASVAAGVPHDRQVAAELGHLIEQSQLKSAMLPKENENGDEKDKAGTETPPAPLGVIQLDVPQYLIAFLLQFLQRLLTT